MRLIPRAAGGNAGGIRRAVFFIFFENKVDVMGIIINFDFQYLIARADDSF